MIASSFMQLRFDEIQFIVMVSLKSDTLLSNIVIPSDRFRPLSTTVTFSVETPNLHLLLSLPRWNTHALSPISFSHVTKIGHLSSFSLSGEYTYHAEVREDCIDQLKLHMKVIKIIMNLSTNAHVR